MSAEKALFCGKNTCVSCTTYDGAESCLVTKVGNTESTGTGRCIDGNEVTGTWSKNAASKSFTWRVAEAVK